MEAPDCREHPDSRCAQRTSKSVPSGLEYPPVCPYPARNVIDCPPPSSDTGRLSPLPTPNVEGSSLFARFT